jgi:AraC-like DNA-binding protein
MGRSRLRGDNGLMAATRPHVSEHVRYVPSATLRPYCGVATGYREAGGAPSVHRGLPSPWMTFIFTLDEPLAIAAHPDARQEPGIFDVLLGGLHSSPALITHEGSQSGIQLALSPLGARPLLGMPASEIASIDVHGADVFGRLAREVHDRVRMAASWPERFAVLDAFLTARLRDADERAGVSAEVRHVWNELLRTKGTAAVASIAAETGWSDRHLRDRFRTETGLGPKEAARVIRFDQVRRRLARRAASGEPLALAGLAVSAGYFDQAHLDREFRALAGCPPTQWLAEP